MVYFDAFKMLKFIIPYIHDAISIMVLIRFCIRKKYVTIMLLLKIPQSLYFKTTVIYFFLMDLWVCWAGLQAVSCIKFCSLCFSTSLE